MPRLIIQSSKSACLAQAISIALLLGTSASAAAVTYVDPGKIGDPASRRTNEFKAEQPDEWRS